MDERDMMVTSQARQRATGPLAARVKQAMTLLSSRRKDGRWGCRVVNIGVTTLYILSWEAWLEYER